MRNNSIKRQLMAGPYLIWMIAFTIIPLIMMGVKAFTNADGEFTLDNVLAMGNEVNIQALILSLELALISTVICLLLAYPLAMILRKMKDSNGVIVFLFVLPMWMNFLLRTIAWQSLLEKDGVINGILTALHLPTINIINTPAAIVLGMVYNFLPFMILPLYNCLSKIDDNVINAAHDLGANGFQTFVRVILPLSVPGVISGVTMVFVPALTTFVISDILGGSKILLIGNIIEQQFTVNYDWNTGAGLSIVLMLFVLLSMALINIFDKDGEGSVMS